MLTSHFRMNSFSEIPEYSLVFTFHTSTVNISAQIWYDISQTVANDNEILTSTTRPRWSTVMHSGFYRVQRGSAAKIASNLTEMYNTFVCFNLQWRGTLEKHQDMKYNSGFCFVEKVFTPTICTSCNVMNKCCFLSPNAVLSSSSSCLISYAT